MSFLTKVLISIPLLILIILLFFLGYLGFIPGLSNVFGSNSPRDLGVKYTEADRSSARAKTQIEYTVLPPETPVALSIQRFGSRAVNAEFSSNEISALMNNRPWKYWPYKNVQVKFNADGSAEVSGSLIKERIPGYMAAIDIPQEVIDLTMKFLPPDPVFYVKGKATLQNNQVAIFEPQNFEIGRLPIPLGPILSFIPSLSPKASFAANLDDLNSQLSQVKNKRALIIDYINQRLKTITGFFSKNAGFGDNKLTFDGTLPQKEATVR